MTHAIEAGGYVFAVAGAGDDGDIRALLARNPLDGWVRLSLQREPSAFAAGALYDRHAMIVVRDARTGRAVAMCDYGVRRMWVDGAVRAVPYLGALRVDAAWRNRIGLLRHGFAAVRALLVRADDHPAPITAITDDNPRARRLLCAGVDGLPRYWPLGGLATLAIPVRAARRDGGIATATADDLPGIASLLAQSATQGAFAPAWEPDDLARLSALGLPPDRFLVARRGHRIAGCIAVWDQRGFKQAVVRGYAPWLARVRPLHNLLAPMTRMPRLPAPGQALGQVFLSHLAVAGDDRETLQALVRAGLSLAHGIGADLALLGGASGAPWLAALRAATRARVYRSTLHVVQWPGAPEPVIPRGTLQPEIALL